ncbi:hypothetical protein K504DRAFT_457532, partial [Pleomassaria siparia CBS 279.74]
MANLDPVTMLPRGRTTERRTEEESPQNDGGEGEVKLGKHDIEVLDFAATKPNTTDTDPLAKPQTHAVERERPAEMTGKANEPKLNSEKDEERKQKGEGAGGQGENEEKRLETETYGQGPHGPILRKPMLGERGHGRVVRGNGRGRGRGGPGVSVMD